MKCREVDMPDQWSQRKRKNERKLQKAIFIHVKEDPIKQKRGNPISSEVCKQKLRGWRNWAWCSLRSSFALEGKVLCLP